MWTVEQEGNEFGARESGLLMEKLLWSTGARHAWAFMKQNYHSCEVQLCVCVCVCLSVWRSASRYVQYMCVCKSSMQRVRPAVSVCLCVCVCVLEQPFNRKH